MNQFKFADASQLMKAATKYRGTKKVSPEIFASLTEGKNAPVVFTEVNGKRIPQLSKDALAIVSKAAESTNLDTAMPAAQLLGVAKAIRNSVMQKRDVEQAKAKIANASKRVARKASR